MDKIRRIANDYCTQANSAAHSNLVGLLFLDCLPRLEQDSLNRFMLTGDTLTMAIDDEEDVQGEKIETECQEGVSQRTRALGMATVTKCNSCLQKLGFLVHRLHSRREISTCDSSTSSDAVVQEGQNEQQQQIAQESREVFIDLCKYVGAVRELMNDARDNVSPSIVKSRHYMELEVLVGIISTFLDSIEGQSELAFREEEDVKSVAMICAWAHRGVNMVVNFVINAVPRLSGDDATEQSSSE